MALGNPPAIPEAILGKVERIRARQQALRRSTAHTYIQLLATKASPLPDQANHFHCKIYPLSLTCPQKTTGGGAHAENGAVDTELTPFVIFLGISTIATVQRHGKHHGEAEGVDFGLDVDPSSVKVPPARMVSVLDV